MAAKKLQTHLQANPDDIAFVALLLTSFAIENADFTERAIQLFEQVPSLSVISVSEIKEQSADYKKAKAIIISKLDSIKKNVRCGLLDYENFVHADLSHVMSYSSKPVSLFDVGSYKDLKRNEVVNDKMQHDHVSSRAAVHRYLEKKLKSSFPKDSQAFNVIRDNATAVEVCDELHCKGRTFRGRNNSELIILDAKNLLDATVRDFSYHLMGANFDPRVVVAFSKVYHRNNALCLYN